LLSESDWIPISVLKVRQPIGDFYVGTLPAADLVTICKADVRRLEIPQDGKKADLFSYMGIQRPLNQDRVNEIREYVRTIDACFPNTIIIAVPSENIRSEPANGRLFIKRQQDAAFIIDGQHRLAGFGAEELESSFELLVTIFVDLELEEQAYLYSTINSKQTRINPSLAQDLLDFSTVQTPEKVAHNIAKSSNSDPTSPWWRHIKMLGVNDEITEGIITQHAFVTELLSLLYPGRALQNTVRSTLKKHKNDRYYLRSMTEFDTSRYPLWEFYVTGQDGQIKKIIDNYFQSVKITFPEDWANRDRILSKTTGYQALMSQLQRLIPIGVREHSLATQFFLPYVEQARTRLAGRPLTGQEFGAGRAAAEQLRKAMFEEDNATSHSADSAR